MIDTAVVLNPGAGGASAEAKGQEIVDRFAQYGRRATLFTASERSPVAAQAHAAVDAGCRLLVAGGGDGTVNAVAAVAVAHRIPLGVLPIGSLNHFAKDLGLPLDLSEAVGVAATGAARPVDVGEVNGRLFINNASLGVYPRVVQLRSRFREAGLGKWFAALWATMAVLRRRPFFGVRIQAAGEELQRRTPFVLVGNNEYRMAGLHAVSRDSLSDGHLALYVMNARHRRSLLRLAARVLWSGADRVRELELFRVAAATIETGRSHVQAALDGEVVALAAPLICRCLPGALTVVGPPSGLPSRD